MRNRRRKEDVLNETNNIFISDSCLDRLMFLDLQFNQKDIVDKNILHQIRMLKISIIVRQWRDQMWKNKRIIHIVASIFIKIHRER